MRFFVITLALCVGMIGALSSNLEADTFSPTASGDAVELQASSSDTGDTGASIDPDGRWSGFGETGASIDPNG
ncbi:MAG: hypothetical protein SX243_08475 [Acidobacteriota bacterium]|nr:hypothetical protein [Acidobacteriota bacterium]